MFVRLACTLLMASFLTPETAQAQDIVKYDLFQIDGDELYWRKTYFYSGPQENLRPEVVGMLKSKFFTFNVVRNEAGYIGEIRHYSVDCKRYGRTYLNTPRMYWDGEWTGKFIVEIQDNQYRVSVYALYFEKMEQSVGYYRNEKPVKGRYIDAVVRKDRRSFKKGEFSNLDLMDVSLGDNFDIKQKSVIPEQR